MKKIIIMTTVMLMAGTSCRSLKEGWQYRYSSALSDEKITSLIYSHYDSLDRLWLFQTDSVFHYRPGEGLYGTSGKLWISEKEMSESEQAEITFAGHSEEESLLEKEKKVVYSQKSYWIAGLVFLILFFLLFRVWKRRLGSKD